MTCITYNTSSYLDRSIISNQSFLLAGIEKIKSDKADNALNVTSLRGYHFKFIAEKSSASNNNIN
jgi:hypothetical protein